MSPVTNIDIQIEKKDRYNNKQSVSCSRAIVQKAIIAYQQQVKNQQNSRANKNSGVKSYKYMR